jgi:hypothetical protein
LKGTKEDWNYFLRCFSVKINMKKLNVKVNKNLLINTNFRNNQNYVLSKYMKSQVYKTHYTNSYIYFIYFVLMPFYILFSPVLLILIIIDMNFDTKILYTIHVYLWSCVKKFKLKFSKIFNLNWSNNEYLIYRKRITKNTLSRNSFIIYKQ